MENVTLKLNQDTGDLVIDDTGMMQTVSGDDTTSQNIWVNLKTCKGDFGLVPDHGTDLDRVLGQLVPDDEVAEVIRESIYQESKIAMIPEITASRAARTVNVSFKARTDTTEIDMEVNL